jgi:hypothetical protein
MRKLEHVQLYINKNHIHMDTQLNKRKCSFFWQFSRRSSEFNHEFLNIHTLEEEKGNLWRRMMIKIVDRKKSSIYQSIKSTAAVFLRLCYFLKPPQPPCFHNSLQRPWLVTDLPKHFQRLCIWESEKSEMIYFNLSIFLLSLRSISFACLYFILELHVKIKFTFHVQYIVVSTS